MAAVYNLEPQPTAKVVLRTTSGDILLELFAKQIPLASRNFLQHCLDGYYDNTIFHRLVPGFIIQGGDPTGTGSGGISAINDGDPFQDEFHSRLKFNRRGLLGMANEGKDNNASQFFLTLGATPELQNKHTMFGRVEGDTIYNLMKMADAELVEGENSDRPLYPTRITGTEIIVNPFDDMVARARIAPRTSVDQDKPSIKKRKKPAGKNVLSFGVEEEETAAPVLKKSRANPKLIQQVEAVEKPIEPSIPKAQLEKRNLPREQSSLAEPIENTRPPATVPAPTKRPTSPSAHRSAPRQSTDDESHSDLDQPTSKSTRAAATSLAATNAEIAAIKASLRRDRDGSDRVVAATKFERPKTTLEAMIPASSTRGRKRGRNGGVVDEGGALDLFRAFKARLEDMPQETNEKRQDEENGEKDERGGEERKGNTGDGKAEEDEDEAALCDLHFIANCQSCKRWDDGEGKGGDDDDDDDRGGDWMAHKLSFAKDTLGKDLEWKRKMEEIEIVDPREKARSIKEERRKGRSDRDGGGRRR